MKFVKYPSIFNTFKGDTVDYIKINHAEDIKDLTWNVYEKIYGANFSIWYDGTELKTAKRSGWIGTTDFYGCSKVVKKYTKNIETLYSYLQQPFVVYCELFGGIYNGLKDTNSTKTIQKGVQYCPHNDLAVIDIATINEDSSLEYLSENAFHDLAFASGLFIAPYLNEYKTLEEALEVNPEFQTIVPTRWSLKLIENNMAEGVVIKPSVPLFMHDGKRIIFKKKNPLFKEEKSVDVPSVATNQLMQFFETLRANFTSNRLDNVISHDGDTLPRGNYFMLFYQDSLDNCDQVVYNTLSEDQKRLLKVLSAKYIWPLINERFPKDKSVA